MRRADVSQIESLEWRIMPNMDEMSTKNRAMSEKNEPRTGATARLSVTSRSAMAVAAIEFPISGLNFGL